MSKTPAFNFYPADASEDTQFMNRLERGAYFDLIKAQKMFRGFTVVQLRKVLGKDFDDVWPALELVLQKDDDGFYYIGWVRESIEQRANYSKKQSERVKKRWDNQGNTAVLPQRENEIENENEIEKKGKKKSVRKGKPFVPPKLEEVEVYFLDHGFSRELAGRAFEHYELGDPPWTDAKGDPVRAWKQKMRTNWMTEKNRKQEYEQQSTHADRKAARAQSIRDTALEIASGAHIGVDRSR